MAKIIRESVFVETEGEGLDEMEWSIQSPGRFCYDCLSRFNDGEQIHAILIEEHNSYQRIDVCLKCWQERWSRSENRPPNLVSHWQTRFRVPAERNRVLTAEKAEQLLRRLLDDGRHETQALCYVLALLLERKRLLKVRGYTDRAGQRVCHYEHAKTGELFHIVDPGLTASQLDLVIGQVKRLIEEEESGTRPT